MGTITLSEEDILRIHEALVQEFCDSGNPIYPPGVKSSNLLGSAVSRQHSSLGETLKYPDPIHNAATLTFGICCDHPFHNGNKRTGLVSLLVHLDRNRLSLAGVPHGDLFCMIISIADHTVTTSKDFVKHPLNRPSPDDDVEAIAHWLRQRTKPIKRGERQITYRELRKIIAPFGYELANPKGNAIEIMRVEEVKPLFRASRTIRRRIATIPYPRDGGIVSMKDIKYIRSICCLREEDGIDSDAFYSNGAVIDTFINQHRNILRRLANK